MGGAKPSEILPEMRKQGVLIKDGEATTKNVLFEEQRIIQYAREGKGACGAMGNARPGSQVEPGAPLQLGRDEKRPLGLGSGPSRDETRGFAPRDAVPELLRPSSSSHQQSHPATPPAPGQPLSAEQQVLFRHVMASTDRLNLIIADAGTGKTTTAKPIVEAIRRETGKMVVMLAPSAAASRGVLRSEGFHDANTIASFLNSPERQAEVKNGVIFIDEAAQAPIRDISRLIDIAKEQSARMVLMGDNKQHASPSRSGNLFNVLREYAGIEPGKLQEIWRQRHQGYKSAVADIACGKLSDGFDKLNDLGWIKRVEGNTPLVDDYFEALRTKKATQSEQDRAIIVAPTHIEGQEITAEIRQRLKDQGKLKDDKTFDQLIPLNRSIAEQGDLERYDGTETMVFHRNSGTFKAGQTVKVTEWKTGDRFKSSEHFSLYKEGKLSLAAGDVIRFTKNGTSIDGHQIDNGSTYKVKGFDKHDNIVLENGWTVGRDFRHVTHGYVSTSHAAQGKTVDRVFVAMGSESRGAINSEQFYVSVSRGREATKIYTDMPAADLKQAILKTDPRKSATELMEPKPRPKPKSRMRGLMKKARERFKQMRDKAADITRGITKQKEYEYAGQER